MADPDQERLILLATPEFIQLEDGYYYYDPNPGKGCLSSWMLRTLAEELDRKNKKWDDEINKYFEEQDGP